MGHRMEVQQQGIKLYLSTESCIYPWRAVFTHGTGPFPGLSWDPEGIFSPQPLGCCPRPQISAGIPMEENHQECSRCTVKSPLPSKRAQDAASLPLLLGKQSSSWAGMAGGAKKSPQSITRPSEKPGHPSPPVPPQPFLCPQHLGDHHSPSCATRAPPVPPQPLLCHQNPPCVTDTSGATGASPAVPSPLKSCSSNSIQACFGITPQPPGISD